MLDSSDIGYTYLECSHLIECERLNDSLNIEDRNPREADPESFYKKRHIEKRDMIHNSQLPLSELLYRVIRKQK